MVTMPERIGHPSLTARQRQVLDFITARAAADGAWPTVREIMGHLGVRSPNAALQHVKALVRKGVLRQSRKGRWHGYQPVDAGLVWVRPEGDGVTIHFGLVRHTLGRTDARLMAEEILKLTGGGV